MSTPDEVEPLILSLTKEYLKKKPFFSIEDIVVYISNRTRSKPYLNKNKIEKSIKDLIKKRRLIPGNQHAKSSKNIKQLAVNILGSRRRINSDGNIKFFFNRYISSMIN